MEAAILAGGIEERMLWADHDLWPRELHVLLDDLQDVVNDPSSREALGRGSRLGLRDRADAAMEWLERAYPESASISV